MTELKDLKDMTDDEINALFDGQTVSDATPPVTLTDEQAASILEDSAA